MTTKKLQSIKETLQLLRKKSLTIDEICHDCVTRQEKLYKLNAFITMIPQQSPLNSNHKHPGVLGGLPVAIKDNFSTKNINTTCASKMLENYKPPYTATVVQRLLDNGANIAGKTNLDEFAMGCGSTDSFFGPVRNPWKYDFSNSDSKYEDWYIAGGSSGGSAVAVATGMVYAALGSDTGGSTRNPAALNGIVGLKPTYGLLSRHGLIPLVNSLDCPGILTRTVDDAVLMLNLLAGRDNMDSTTAGNTHTQFTLPDEPTVAGMKIGVPREYHVPEMSSDVVDVWDTVAGILDNAGAKVVPVSLPHTQYSIVCYTVLCCCEVASNMARFDGVEFGHRAADNSSTEALYAQSRHEGFNDVVRGRILAGTYLLQKKQQDKHYVQAQRIRRLISKDFNNVFFHPKGVDLLLAPTLIGDSIKYSEFKEYDNIARSQEQDICTQPINLAGLPAVNIPVTLSSNDLPIGLQLIGKQFHEEQLLTAAKWVEQNVEFPSGNWDHVVFVDS